MSVKPINTNTHISTDFGALLEPGLRKIFFETYAEVPEQYSKVYNLLTSSKAKEVDYGLGAFGDWTARNSELDEVALFQKANQLKTEDLEFVYKALQYDNLVAKQADAVKAAATQMQAEIDANKSAVSTIVGTNQSNIAQPKKGLTDAEKAVAAKMGVSEADYLKWKV